MTVSTQTPSASVAYSGSPNISYTFRVLSSADMRVTYDGVVKTLGLHYTVGGVNQPSGGIVTLIGELPAIGQIVKLQRATVLFRSLDYQTQGDFLAAQFNYDFDRLWMALQELAAAPGTANALRIPDAEFGLYTTTLPAAAARANKFAHFDAVGNADVAELLASGTVLSKSVLLSYLNRLRQNAAVGNDVSDDTIPVANALSGLGPLSIIDLDEGRYATTTLDLSKGVQFTGAGFISDDQVVRTPWGRRQPLAFGREFLYAWHNRILTEQQWRVTLTGDSTTAGTGASSPFYLDELFLDAAQRRGAPAGEAVNRGQSGKNTSDWLSTYIAGDLIPQPHLLIVRWGINDFAQGVSPAQTIANIRTGLATIRATYGVKDLAIVLCTPNTTSDSPNNRDERTYEQLIHGYRQAALDYQCAYLDVYSMFQDSRGGSYATGNSASQLWMDDPFSDGRAIHPKNIMNAWIVSALADLCFGGVELFGHGGIVVNGGVANARAGADLPARYNKGVSLHRALNPGTWPVDGFVLTHSFVNDGQMQTNFGYQDQLQRAVRTRFGRAGAWDPWDGVNIAPTLANAWVNDGGASQIAGYTRDMYGRVSLQGLIKSGTATAGTTLFTLPAAYRPVGTCWFSVACSGATGQVKITAAGVVSIEAGNNTFLSLDGINFMAGN